MEFTLHPRLAADCFIVGRLPLSLLLMLNDQRYPWFILVPRRSDTGEVFQLEETDQQQLWRESSQLARGLMTTFHADKINIGALGNLVPQLHVHHVARFRTDPAWPAPVWGHSDPLPYDDILMYERMQLARNWFGDTLEADPA